MATEMTNTQSAEKPALMFKVFVPTEEKLNFLGKVLMDGYLNLSDEKRNQEAIEFILKYRFNSEMKNEFYEVGDFGAIIGFIDIIPGHKGRLIMKFWDRKIWGKRFVRETRKLIKATMKQFGLKRLEADTPDERVKQMAEIAGFKLEGTKLLDFRWNGEFFPTYILSIIYSKEE